MEATQVEVAGHGVVLGADGHGRGPEGTRLQLHTAQEAAGWRHDDAGAPHALTPLLARSLVTSLRIGQTGACVVGKVEIAVGVVDHADYRAIIAQVAIALLTLVQ